MCSSFTCPDIVSSGCNKKYKDGVLSALGPYYLGRIYYELLISFRPKMQTHKKTPHTILRDPHTLITVMDLRLRIPSNLARTI